MAEFDDAFDDLGDHRPDIYWEDQRRVFRASSFGSCDSYLIRVGLGQTPAPPPENIAAKMADSSRLEAPLLKRLSEQEGWRMLTPVQLRAQWGTVQPETGQLEVELAVPGGIIRCHPDAIAKCYRAATSETRFAVGDHRVVEAKAMRAGSGDPLAKNPNYPWQVAIEMAATKLPMLFAVGWKTAEGELTDDPITVHYIDTPPHSLGEIKVRARQIQAAIDAAEIGACTRKMWPCGFWMEHDTETGIWAEKDTEELDGVTPEFDKLVADWARIDEEVRELAKERDRLKSEVLEVMRERGVVGTRRAGGIVFKRVVEATSRLDKDALKRDGVDVDRYYVAGNGKDFVQLEKKKGEGR